MKSTNKVLTKIAASMLLMSCAMNASANLISNGNFATGSYATVPNWTLSGAVYVIPYANYGLSGTWAGSANGALFGFTNVLNDPNLLSQTISTVTGSTYTLTFDYGSYSGYSNLVQSNNVTVVNTSTSSTLLNQIVTTPSSSSSSLAAMFLTHAVYTFTATGSSTTINFQDVSAVTQNVDSFLTNVAVNTSTIPLPGTLALLGLGFVGLSMNLGKRS